MVRVDLPRKLKAIMAADVEGYSRLIGNDEVAAIKLLARCKKVLSHEVTRYRGTLFGEAGDGFMIEFDSAEDAVRCGVGVQKEIAKTNARRHSGPIWLRIGISLGDIIDDGGAKYGTAINIAARVQTISDPGGVCITSPVFEQVANTLAYAFDQLGPAHLKNIPRPVDLVKVRWAENSRPAPAHIAAAPGSPNARKPSIAVLPFTFLGSHQDEPYFADGLVEEIITELSRYRWLSVVSKSSSFAYKARNVDMRLIARELGVRYLIEGSLRRDASNLRINLHLISGESGEGLWSDRFDRPVHEVFELQEDMVLGIVGAIEPKVKSAEIQRARKIPTESLTAYDYYLQALPYRGAISSRDNQSCLQLLEKAIDLDPRFAPALALASMCYATRKDQGWGALDQEEIRKALHLARSAIESDFDDPTALHLSAHTIASIGGDISGAISLIDRSLQISPSCSEAWARSSMIRIYAGDLATAEQHAENSIRLSPLDERIFLPLCALGYCYLFSGRNSEAIEAARRALLGRPRPPMAYKILLAASHMLGDKEVAREAVAALAQAAPHHRLEDWLAQSCFVREDQYKILRAAFRSVELPG
jgi:TolB-like protein/class 3 adenylate cyclase